MSEAFILHFYIKENSLVMVYLKILEKHISFINKVNLQDGRSINMFKKEMVRKVCGICSTIFLDLEYWI